MSWALLIALLVKSSVVAGAGLACARFLTWRAVERVDILRATVCLLLALPAVTALLPSIDLALLPPLPIEAPPPVVLVERPVVDPAETAAWTWPPSGQTLGALWLFGVVLVAGRLMLGLRTLARWTRQGEPVTCPAWLAPIEDLPPVDRPKLASSDRIDGPLSWGVAPGSILVDPATLADRHAASAIMAHELAHLRRHDWLFLVLSRLALAIFWFNPLVWRLHAVLAERSEEAADAGALRFVDRALYARTLVRLASHPVPRASVPHLATAMAADARTLKTRIACIMTDTSDRRRPLTLALTVVALAAVATPLAALGLARQEASSASPVAPVAPVAPPAPVAPVDPVAPATPARQRHVHTAHREVTPEALAAAEQARADAETARDVAEAVREAAEEGRRAGEEARRIVEAHRGEIEAARRMAADARAQGDWAREVGERAREAGERAREAGERARVEAARHMVEARAHMAEGAVQMRQGAKDMREEAARLRDPAYRARQIEKSRARGETVTDEQLRALSDSLPKSADALERSADRLAERSRQAS